MSPDIRRFLPFILIAMFAILVVPSLLKGKKSSSVSAGDRAAQTTAAVGLVDSAEQAYLAAHGRYTEHVADLITPKLAAALAVGVGVQLDVGTDGKSYYARVDSENLSFVRARVGAKKVADSCLVLKSGSGVKCPVVAAPATPAK